MVKRPRDVLDPELFVRYSKTPETGLQCTNSYIAAFVMALDRIRAFLAGDSMDSDEQSLRAFSTTFVFQNTKDRKTLAELSVGDRVRLGFLATHDQACETSSS